MHLILFIKCTNIYETQAPNAKNIRLRFDVFNRRDYCDLSCLQSKPTKFLFYISFLMLNHFPTLHQNTGLQAMLQSCSILSLQWVVGFLLQTLRNYWEWCVHYVSLSTLISPLSRTAGAASARTPASCWACSWPPGPAPAPPPGKSPRAPDHTASWTPPDTRAPPPPGTPPGGWSCTSSCPAVDIALSLCSNEVLTVQVVVTWLTFLCAHCLPPGAARLPHGGLTSLHNFPPGLVPALLPLLGPALLPRKLQLNVDTNLLELDLLHPCLTAYAGDTPHLLIANLSRFHHLYVATHFSWNFPYLQKRQKYW